MLRSIIQIRPLLKGAWRRGKPRSSRAASMRTIESRHDPVDDGLGTRGFLDAEGQGQESQDATDGAKADANL